LQETRHLRPPFQKLRVFLILLGQAVRRYRVHSRLGGELFFFLPQMSLLTYVLLFLRPHDLPQDVHFSSGSAFHGFFFPTNFRINSPPLPRVEIASLFNQLAWDEVSL